MRAAALLQGREVRPEPHPEQGLYYLPISSISREHGVPALFVKAGIDDSARGPAWGQAQLDDYMAHRYHQPSDKYSDDWDVRGAVEDLGALLRSGRAAGEHPALPAVVSEQRIQLEPQSRRETSDE